MYCNFTTWSAYICTRLGLRTGNEGILPPQNLVNVVIFFNLGILVNLVILVNMAILENDRGTNGNMKIGFWKQNSQSKILYCCSQQLGHFKLVAFAGGWLF